MIAPGQQASIGTVPDKQGLITVLGVGSIETISKDFFKMWEKLDRNLDLESVWDEDKYLGSSI